MSLKHIRQSINHWLLQVHERLGEVALGGARQRKRRSVFGPAELVGSMWHVKTGKACEQLYQKYVMPVGINRTYNVD